MRIGVVTTSYPRHEGDHAGNFVGAHVAALRAAGHTVDVLGAHTIASPLFDAAGAPDALERGGLATYLAAASFSARLTWETRRRIASWDAVIAHWLAPSALAALVARTTASPPRPLLAIAHGGDVHTLRRMRLLAPVLHALHAAGARLAFVSDELRAVARRTAPLLDASLSRALVQPMGIDVARFAALARPSQRAPRPTVVIVSRLVPVKGLDVAIAAVAQLTEPVRLVIAGEGPERARLGALAARLRVPAELVGQVDADGRDALLREASCVVVPSRVLANGRTEGTPLIALEALAAGVPVVASAVGGLGELVGITRVRPDDPGALAAAITRTLASPPARVDMTSYDWSRVSARLFSHLLGRPANVTDLHPGCETDDSTGRRTA